MRFRLIDAAKKEFPVQRLCKVLGVSQSGYFARKDRPACRRQHEDMVLLAHIRSAFGDCQEFRVRAGRLNMFRRRPLRNAHRTSRRTGPWPCTTHELA